MSGFGFAVTLFVALAKTVVQLYEWTRSSGRAARTLQSGTLAPDCFKSVRSF
jgi:hypothetical protein